jgi:methyl-accepting chemotaxis protein
MLKHLKISTRLRLMAVMPLVFLLLVSIFAWSGLRSGVEGLKTVQADTVTANQLWSIVTDVYRIRAALTNALITTDEKDAQRTIKITDEGSSEILKLWNAYIDHPMPATEKELAESTGKDLNLLLDQTVQPAVVALRKNDFTTATTLLVSPQYRDLIQKVRDQLDQLQQMQNKSGKQLYLEAEQRALVLNWASVGVFFAAALILGTFSWLTIAAIRRPVEGMRAALIAAQQSNDLTQRVKIQGKDEVSEMARAFNSLMESLQATLNQVMTDAQEVSSAATQMASASTQMTESSRVQSESAASTAAAVELVTVSINQVADNSRETRSVSEQAC